MKKMHSTKTMQLVAFAAASLIGTAAQAAVTAVLSGPATIYEGSPYNYQLEVTNNAGSLSFVYATIAWGDLTANTVVYKGDAPISPLTAAHTFANDGNYTISLVNGQPGPGTNPFYSYAVVSQGIGSGPEPISASMQVTVLNVAPTITSAPTGTWTLDPQNPVFTYKDTAATDPGVDDTLTYDWELTGDALYDDYRGKIPNKTYNTPGTYNLGLRVFDGTDNVYSNFVLIVAPIPEPATFGLLGIAGLGLLRRRRA